MERLDAVVIGAGVIGLAVARALALAGREVVVLEAEASFGTHTSSRNSEVIHAGIYYTPGSLKARLCVPGKALLYRYCAERGVAHRRIGKLLVAVEPEEIPRLEHYVATAHANGLDDLQPLDAGAVHALEPEVHAVAGVLSPSTGIVDSHALMLSLLGDLERAGGMLVCNSPVQDGRPVADGLELRLGGVSDSTVHSRTVVNCAGLHASAVALALGVPAPRVPQTRYARGHYFSLAGAAPFRRLVYPMPDAASLGIHLTLDLAGQARFGPDVQWIPRIDYQFPDDREDAFRASIARYFPGIATRELQPAYCGIRPKIGDGLQATTDFELSGPEAHGIDGLLNLFGIESPGLTCSLALAATVCTRLGGNPPRE